MLSSTTHKAWQQGRQASSGKMADKGFYDEQFDEKSARYAARGEDIAEGWFGAFCGCKADRKSRRENHFFRRHQSA